MSGIKVIGDLRKYEVVEPFFKDIIVSFFKDAYDNNDLLEDIVYDWSQNPELNEYVLFPINNYISQINTVANNLPNTYDMDISDSPASPFMFLFLKEITRLGPESIRNAEELSGDGRLITTFELKFADYNQKYLRDKSNNFFDLNPNQIILNSIRLTASGNSDRRPGMQLTGKAAEIAAKREELNK